MAIDPAKVVEASDALRTDGDLFRTAATSVPVSITGLTPMMEALSSHRPYGMEGLQATLAAFERACSAHAEGTATTLRAVADHLAIVAFDATRADRSEYVRLPAAGS